jgi:hypothetical protein
VAYSGWSLGLFGGASRPALLTTIDIVNDGFQLSLGADASTSYTSASVRCSLYRSSFRLSSSGVPQIFCHKFLFVEKKESGAGKRKIANNCGLTDVSKLGAPHPSISFFF